MPDPFVKCNLYKAFFAAYGFGPYECYFCHEPVGFGEVNIHHLNEDQTCNHPYNLVGAHHGCHNRFHTSRLPVRRGWKHTAEARAKISAANRNRRQSAEEREMRSEANKGRRHSEETKAKIRAAALKRWERARA